MDLSGTVTSFNYGTSGSQTGTRQLANENYGICIEMQPGFCSIQWSQSAGGLYTFSVSGDTYTAVGTAMSGDNCTTDFVVIPSPMYVDPTLTPPNTDRFCGNAFNSVTCKRFFFTITKNC